MPWAPKASDELCFESLEGAFSSDGLTLIHEASLAFLYPVFQGSCLCESWFVFRLIPVGHAAYCQLLQTQLQRTWNVISVSTGLFRLASSHNPSCKQQIRPFPERESCHERVEAEAT